MENIKFYYHGEKKLTDFSADLCHPFYDKLIYYHSILFYSFLKKSYLKAKGTDTTVKEKGMVI